MENEFGGWASAPMLTEYCLYCVLFVSGKTARILFAQIYNAISPSILDPHVMYDNMSVSFLVDLLCVLAADVVILKIVNNNRSLYDESGCSSFKAYKSLLRVWESNPLTLSFS